MIVFTSASEFLSRWLAMLRRRAATSWVVFAFMVSGSSSPPAPTGEAAPMVVPGDMAATCADATRNVPADAALDPEGVTRTAMGTGESRMSPTISRIDSRSPPGVSSSSTKS